MYYDLNVPWTADAAEVQRKLSFLAELGYSVVALNHSLSGKLPADITCPIPSPLPISPPATLRILRRLTLTLTDPSQNHRLKALSDPTSNYDLLALRPTDEKTLAQACQSQDCDLISLDLTRRYPFHFKHKTFISALDRGVRIELTYGPALTAPDPAARRNLIMNASAIIRVTRGRGLVFSSEAATALAARGPADVINLAVVWGLTRERGAEAVGSEARAVVVAAAFKRTSYRGVVDVVYGGEKPAKDEPKAPPPPKGKRKAEEPVGAPAQVSKREQKRRAQAARREGGGADGEASTLNTTTVAVGTPKP
ncbi:PHP domain-like protein [Trichodelitschia bisporula]|uniref:PHP domain-like protein n=1 Tax=Trichodelitschia bisporula TaxID=703511 RepID=A0A6G1I6P9_9PEZI|nr:PHP domain-like protein [Trichodelitschia bisporula]